MKKLYSEEDYMQKKLKEGRYLIVYCMTDKSAHFLYRLFRGNDSHKKKGNPDIFFFKSISNQKRAGAVKFFKNCPKTWLVLAGAFKRYGDDIMVWGSNRIYNFHLPNQLQLLKEVQTFKIINSPEFKNVDENLNNIQTREVLRIS